MLQKNTPKETYKYNMEILSAYLKILNQKRSYLGWLRLLIVIAILFLIYHLFFNSSLLTWLLVAAGIATFLYVISIDTDNSEKIGGLERLLKINIDELAVINGNYYNREDGIAFLPAEHPYAADIDLFGRASIYQYINRCTSEQSKKLLASLLLHSSEKDTVNERQQAARELSLHTEWRQQLQSSGMGNPLTVLT